MSTQPLEYQNVLTLSERATFIVRTYVHLLMALLFFVALELFIFEFGYAETIYKVLFANEYSWICTMLGFVTIGNIAHHYASTMESQFTQYMGLSLYVIANAIICVPMLYIVHSFAPGLIEIVVYITLISFGILSAIVWFTRKDFSFLKPFIWWISMVALSLIATSFVFNITLGIWFSALMLVLAGGLILSDTSSIIHTYPVDGHVGASLELFSSITVLFWYILRFSLECMAEISE